MSMNGGRQDCEDWAEKCDQLFVLFFFYENKTATEAQLHPKYNPTVKQPEKENKWLSVSYSKCLEH